MKSILPVVKAINNITMEVDYGFQENGTMELVS